MMVSKNILFLSVLASLLSAEIYNTPTTSILQDKNVTKNKFLYGSYQEIVRFDPLLFKEGTLENESKKYLETIVKEIKKHITQKEKVSISVIGHYDEPTDDYYEKSAASKTYASKIQNSFRYELDSNDSLKKSKKYALNVKKRLIDDGIDEKLITLEFRAGEDKAYTNATMEGRKLSRRVLVSMYTLPPDDIDSDKDGVFDSVDKCPGTPRGAAVDKYGCPIDSDKDGVVDYKDQCPDTLRGVAVDSKGCPIDTDGDGVADYKDKCPNTPKGFEVDINGCKHGESLGLVFETNSNKILRDSYGKIIKFSSFLKRNPYYDVIIIGHTDSRGKASKNMQLSLSRAKATKEALVAEGISASRLQVEGKGELEPLKSNRTEEGRQANRRIEIKLIERQEKMDESTGEK